MYFNQVEFGQRVKELRMKKGVTQEELAEEINYTFEHINKIERGRNGCSVDLLLELSAYFQVSTDYLLTGRDYRNMVAKKQLENVINELSSVVRLMEME